jgi:beta-N-acetylhexosaminidase
MQGVYHVRVTRKGVPLLASIRPYEPERDAPAVFELWRATIGLQWPLTAQRFHSISLNSYAVGHRVATDGNRVVGFAAAHRAWETAATATLTLLLVAPDVRRRGIGTALHDATLAHLRAQGIRRVLLGAGDVHFWEGVPDNCPEALSFFQARGWTITGTVYDLIQDVREVRIPPDLAARVGGAVRFTTPTARDEIHDLFAFVAREFPNWLAEYRAIAERDTIADYLIGRDRSRAIVASLIIFSPQSDQTRGDGTWSLLLGTAMGALGCVGVAEAERGRGIGLALVARGAEIVRERGGQICHIHWTAVPGFYECLGYRIWHSFAMSSRDL